MERYELDQNFDIIVKAPCCAKRCLLAGFHGGKHWNWYGVVSKRSNHT